MQLEAFPDRTMNRSKHGSDTHVFDQEGRFHPQLFENIFTKFDKENKGGLTFTDGMRMLVCMYPRPLLAGLMSTTMQHANRVVADFVSCLTILGCGILLTLASPNRLAFVRLSRVTQALVLTCCSSHTSVAGFIEWLLTYFLVAKDGIVYKDDLRKVYDGSIFFEKVGKKDNHPVERTDNDLKFLREHAFS